MRDAGALIVGKTVTTEFAGPSAPGLTRNPHDLEHTPGGSSSGSAAGVAAGLFPLALGTQTGGSVIRPAAYCGIVGFKPGFERIPRDGVILRSRSVDQVGLFTQDVPGMRTAAAVVCDEWASDPPQDDGPPTIGLPQDSFLGNATGAARDAFDAQIASFESAGYPVTQVAIPTLDEFDALLERHRWMTRGETAMAHHQWFEEYEPFYRTGSAEEIRDGRRIPVEQVSRGRASRHEFRSEIEDLMDDHGIDLWATPAAPGPAPETIRSIGTGTMNTPWTHAGLPAVTLPDTTSHRLPLGVQLVSAYDTDEKLLAWAEPLAEEL